jgi:hypothetical protein
MGKDKSGQPGKKAAAGKTAGKTAAAAAGRPAGKRAGASPAGGAQKSEKRLLLEEELQEAIAQVDEEGLAFLLSQAHVLIHNAQVQRINQELAELDRKNRAARKALSAAGGAAPAAAGALDAAGAASVSIEGSSDGKATFLSIGGTRKVLALDELKRLVRICYAADSKSAALHQLFRVLARERNDILVDAKISGPSSPLIEGLFHALREKYHLEDR